jgi:hypothetical protein
VGRASFQTPLGEIWLWGEQSRFESDLPAVVVIPGVFCRPDALWFRMQDLLPQAAVFAGQLPGHLCPPLSKPSIPAFARAFGHVIATAFGGRPVLVVGESVGGLVTLALANPGIGRLALDPLLQTHELWPLRAFLERMHETERPHRSFIETVFGFDGQALRPIDYLPLIQPYPARVVVGGLPLMPERPMQGNLLPSLVGEAERKALHAAPHIHLTTVTDGGHVLVWFEGLMVRLIAEELERTVARWRHASPRWAKPEVAA